MTQHPEAFLRAEGYRCLQLTLRSEGAYTPKDSEWNYSDVPHLNVVHTRVSGHTLACTRHVSTSLFLQRFGPLLVPASVHATHHRADCHDYLIAILTIVVLVQTRHEPHPAGCLTTTSYAFHYRGPFGWLLAHLARLATRRNYSVLMGEDLPMREQRHALRRRGVRFSFDSVALIGFTDTLDTSASHVDASAIRRTRDAVNLQMTGNSGMEVLPDFLLRVVWSETAIELWPLICPHEGAPLKADSACAVADGLTCPWHGRRLRPLLVLPKGTHTSTTLSFCGQQLAVRVTGMDDGGMRLGLEAFNSAT